MVTAARQQSLPACQPSAPHATPHHQHAAVGQTLHQSCGNSTPAALHSHADRDAQVLDFVQFNRRAALNSSLKHSACSYLPPKDAVPGADESIHMYPFDLSPQCEVRNLQEAGPTKHAWVHCWSACLCCPSTSRLCELTACYALCCAGMQVMLLLASAPCSPFLRNDLGSSGKLQFKAHARELGAQAVQVLDVDLAPLVHLPARQLPAGAAAAGPLSNGHQTMVIAAVYTVRRRPGHSSHQPLCWQLLLTLCRRMAGRVFWQYASCLK